jgi:hypothetical protein
LRIRRGFQKALVCSYIRRVASRSKLRTVILRARSPRPLYGLNS